MPARAEASEVIADGVRVFTKRVHVFLFLFVFIMPADSNCVKPQDVGGGVIKSASQSFNLRETSPDKGRPKVAQHSLPLNGDSNHYKFTGKERDSETGLDYFGARHYSNG